MRMDLSECANLAEIPDLSKATKLESLILDNCKSLVMLPSTIGNLQKLVMLEMKECTGLEVLPIDVNLSSLLIVNLKGCSRLSFFPQISCSSERLNLKYTAIEEVPCCIENFPRLTVLRMRGCKRVSRSPQISSSIKKLDLDDTDLDEQVLCYVENLSRLTVLKIRGFKKLRNISQDIFRLTSLHQVDYIISVDLDSVWVYLIDLPNINHCYK